jgi:polyphosphate kinase 2 (PPK2 family)
LPSRGRIGIFNRSYYEEVLVVKVHPEILAAQQLPPPLVTPHIWAQRYEDINAFERYLSRNGTVIRKFFLHVSKEEQRRRLLERLDEPAKNWKFQSSDLDERDRWDAPWFVVPADHKWFTRVAIAELVGEALEGLDLAFPKPSKEQLAGLAKARRRLARS